MKTLATLVLVGMGIFAGVLVVKSPDVLKPRAAHQLPYQAQ